MRYTAVLLLLMLAAIHTYAQDGYITEGQTRGGMYPYALGGIAINEGETGWLGGLGIKTYGKDYAPLGGQVELAVMNTGISFDDSTTGTATFLNFSFMGAVTTFRKNYNYHVAIGPSMMFNISDNTASTLYNFYPRIEAGAGYGIFMVKAGLNLSLNNSYTSLYSFTLSIYPTRKKLWQTQ